MGILTAAFRKELAGVWGTMSFDFDTHYEFDDLLEEHGLEEDNLVSVELNRENSTSEQDELDDFAKVNKDNWKDWLEAADKYEDMRDYEKAAFYYLVEELNYDLSDSLLKYEDVNLVEGDAEEAARDYIQSCYDLERQMGSLESYFNYKEFGEDCVRAGEWFEFSFQGKDYIVTNHSNI